MKKPPPHMHSVEDELLALVDRVDAEKRPEPPSKAQPPPKSPRTHRPSSK